MAEKNDPYLVWKIAGGIVLGLLIVSGIERYQRARAMNAAMAEFNSTMAELRKPGADPLGWRKQAQQHQKQEAAKREALKRTNALKPGERCISKQRFRRVANGWEQIGSC